MLPEQSNTVYIQLSAIEFLGYSGTGHPQFRFHLSPEALSSLNDVIHSMPGRSLRLFVSGRPLTSIFAGPPMTVPYFTVTVVDSTLAGQLHTVALGIVHAPHFFVDPA